MANIDLDIEKVQKKIQQILNETPKVKRKSEYEVAGEILRLSAFEVPHDMGLLQNSGNIHQGLTDTLVGYNKVYAARLHEHPEYNFQKGRKGKYLEDPIKNNLDVFRRILSTTISTYLT